MADGIKWVPALGYYDAANHVKRIKQPVIITGVGLDYTLSTPDWLYCSEIFPRREKSPGYRDRLRRCIFCFECAYREEMILLFCYFYQRLRQRNPYHFPRKQTNMTGLICNLQILLYSNECWNSVPGVFHAANLLRKSRNINPLQNRNVYEEDKTSVFYLSQCGSVQRYFRSAFQA